MIVDRATGYSKKDILPLLLLFCPKPYSSKLSEVDAVATEEKVEDQTSSKARSFS